MLKLTVLLRYSKGNQRICDNLGVLYIDTKTKRITEERSTGIFDYKYADMKKIICDLFTSNKRQKIIFHEIREAGMKIANTKFSDSENEEVAILIDD